jgi:hypothetical protein
MRWVREAAFKCNPQLQYAPVFRRFKIIKCAVNAHQLSRDAMIALSKVKAITQKAIYWEENRRQMSSIIKKSSSPPAC